MARDGTEERFRTRKHLGLLVYLVLEARARPVTRDQLTELLWPAVPGDRGAHSLSQGLSVIRAALGREAIAARGPGIQLVAEVRTEVELLSTGGPLPENLDQPLAGFEHMAGAEFSHWLDATREQLTRDLATALLDDLDAGRRSGDVPRVHEVARKLYRVDPYSEPAVQALCEQHLNDGDAPAAAKLLRRHLDRLVTEVGIAGSPGLHRLLQQVETGHLAMRRVDRTAPRASRHRRPEAFVGREAEVSRLETLWTRTRAGRRQTCLVTGPAGIGKTSLLGRFATSVASRSAAAVEVTCQEIGRDIPFAALADMILALVQYPAASGTEARWLAEASRIAPTLPEIYTGLPEPPPLTGESIRLRLAEAVGRILDAVSEEGPLLLVLDDLMYLDPASRDILHRLLQRHESSPLFVLASARTAEEQGLARVTVDAEVGVRWDEVIPLGALPEGQVHEMLRRLLGSAAPFPPELAAGVAELGDGNPYLIEMLLSDWQRRGDGSLVAAHLHGDGEPLTIPVSSTMHRAFERQYGELTPESERMLSLLAVVGRRLSAGEITQLLGFSASVTDSAALQLLDRGILRIDGGALCFKNQLHRSIVYNAVSTETRKFLHARMGEILAASATPDAQSLLAASHHYQVSGASAAAVDVAIRGSSIAVEQGGAEEALRVLKRVRELATPDQAVRLDLLQARTLVALGQHTEALKHIENLRTIALDSTDHAYRALTRAAALHGARLASDETIKEAVDEAVRSSFQCGDSIAVLRALQLNAEFTSETGQGSGGITSNADCLDLANASAQVKGLAELADGYGQLLSGNYEQGLALFKNSATHFRTASWERELRRALTGVAICQTGLGRYDSAAETLQHSIALAEEVADLEGAANAWSNLGALNDDRGMVADAATCYRRAGNHLSRTLNARRLGELTINAAGLCLTMGEFAIAEGLLSTASEVASSWKNWRLEIETLYAYADLRLGQRRPQEAWTLVERAETLRESRAYPLSDMGRMERLRRHFIWSTKGLDAMRASIQEGSPHRMLMADELEVRAFEEWVYWKEGLLKPDGCSANQALWEHTMLGILTWLARLGCSIGDATTEPLQDKAVESLAQPEIAAAASTCRQLAEQLHFDRMRQLVPGQIGYQRVP